MKETMGFLLPTESRIVYGAYSVQNPGLILDKPLSVT